MKTKISTIVFDCFGVMCPPVVNDWYDEYLNNGGVMDNDFYEILKQFDLGLFSEEQLCEHFSKYKHVGLSSGQIQLNIDNKLSIDTKLIDIIKKLKKNNFKIILLSNANSEFFNRKIYIIYPWFKELFDDIIISSEIKLAKPDPKIFEYLLERINEKSKSVLFVDDSQINIEVAIKTGINGYLYENSDNLIQYLTKNKFIESL